MTEYRSQFGSLSRIVDYLSTHYNPANPWDLYNAAVACGLAGRIAEAESLFAQLLTPAPQSEWHRELHAKSRECQALLADTGTFRKTIEAVTLKARRSLKLPPLETIEFKL